MPPSRKPTSADLDDADAWSRAPRTASDGPTPEDAVADAPTVGVAPRSAELPAVGPIAQGTKLARELADAFRGHVRRALGAPLDDSETSLAFVDHYLRTVRSETRAPILSLIAAEAGAYYGELVCATIGGTWIGDGRDPRRLRVMMRDQFLHFAPVDQALEALLGPGRDPIAVGSDDEGTAIATLDTTFHARRDRTPPAAPSASDAPSEAEPASDDASWLAERLAELPPIGEDEYYSLTCRFETLKLVLELLATKHVGEGKSPREYHVTDYVEALAGRD
jgi:hypothetical protein